MNAFKNIRKTGAPPAVTRKLTNRDKQLFSFYSNRETIIRNRDWKKAKKDIVSSLETACTIAGIRDHYPTETNFRKMADFIAENFGYLHTDEITYAFELAFLGVLDLKDTEVHNLGYFDLPWVTKILRAYLIYRTDRVNYVKGLLNTESVLRNRIETRIQQNEETLHSIRRFYDMYLRYGGFSVNESEPEHIKPSFIFEFMEYVKLIRMAPGVKQAMFDAAWNQVLPDVVRAPDLASHTLTSFEHRIATYKAEDLFRNRAICLVFERWKQEGKTPELIYHLFKTHFCSIDPGTPEIPSFG